MSKTEKKPRPKRPPKVKQKHLEGMEPPSVPAIDAAADHYHEIKTERVKMTAEETTAKDALIDEMNKANLHTYVTPDGLTVTMTAKANVKTTKRGDDYEPNPDEKEEE